MTAIALIEEARADGLELHVNGDRLKLRGASEVVERWKPRIVASKPEILAALSAAPRSTWWLVHFADREPVEVWTSPPATQAEILERRPDAVAAEPILEERAGSADRVQPEPAQTMTPQSCSTCEYVTGRGACGKPVAAGLSDLEGVIYYHQDGGNGCQNWEGNTHD